MTLEEAAIADPLRRGAARVLPTVAGSASPDADVEVQRRKTYVVRSVRLAMALLVAVAVAGTIATRLGQLSPGRLTVLAAAGLAHVAWSLRGSRDAARFVLWHRRSGPPQSWPAPGGARAAVHVAVQFALAEAVVWTAGPAGAVGLLWLVLLPSVGYAVMFLRPPAIAAVAALSLALHTFSVAWWHGGPAVAVALPGFALAVLFTLVFTHIAVSAERARGEVERLAAELGDANERLRAHALQAEELAATRERNRMAREIHDGLGHCLTVVHVQLEAARSTLDRAPADARGSIDKAQAMAHQALQEVRRSVSALRASPLEHRPVPEALGHLVAQSGVAGPATELAVLGDARDLSPQAALTLYRAAQEGLTNCRRHARATSAHLELDYRDAACVRLTVSDDGAGAADSTPDGFGLLGLRERAQLLGGALRVRTAPGQGFALELEVPG